ncbi:MAG: hypothetical protein NVV74_07190 [Magnetospirillum sp.]|nr:hypothetical protein [Magnetospirillum sp.]
MPRLFKHPLPAAILLLSASTLPASASEVGDVAREMRLPAPVVEAVFANVDAYALSADGPANRLMTGVLKEAALKAVKSRLGGLDDAGPGKASEYSAEERNATYKAVVRTTRRDSTEAGECVENKVSLTSTEALPVVKDGAFTFDGAHPRTTGYSWPLTFCRSRTTGGDFSDWTLAR